MNTSSLATSLPMRHLSIESYPSITRAKSVEPCAMPYYVLYTTNTLTPPLRVLSELSVLCLAHRLARGLFAHCDLRDPCLALGIVVDLLGGRLKGRVYFCDNAGDGCEDVGGGLDRLDRADCVAFTHVHVDLGKLDIDDLAEGFLGVVRDAESTWCRLEISISNVKEVVGLA